MAIDQSASRRAGSRAAVASLEHAPSSGRRQRVLVWLVATVAIVAVVWILRTATLVAVPFVFSLFIALAVAPVDAWVQRRVPNRLKWLGHAGAMTMIVLIVAIFFGCIWLAAQRVAAQFPDISQQIQTTTSAAGGPASADPAVAGGAEMPGSAGQTSTEALASGAGSAAGMSDVGGGDQGGFVSSLFAGLTEAGGQLGSAITDYASNFALTILNSAGTTLGVMVLIFFFTLLMLIEAPQWRAKASAILSAREEHDWFESFGIIAEQLRWYLLIRTVLGLITGALYALWLWLFGVDLLLVWGLLAFLLNFIPTLGSLIAGGLAVLYAFVQKDFTTALMIAAGLLVIEQIMGNYVDPRVQGRQLSLSALVVLLALVIWGWIWGIAGALLAVPMTIMIVIVCAHFSTLRPFALLLSDERDMEGLDRVAKQ